MTVTDAAVDISAAEAADLDARAAEQAAAEQEAEKAAELRLRPACISSTDALRLLKNAVPFASPDTTRPMLHAVKLVWGQGRVAVQATDRYRLFTEWVSMKPAAPTDEMRAEGMAAIPLDQAKKLIKRLASPDKTERIEMWRLDNRLMVATVDYTPTGDRVDVTATYPIRCLDDEFVNVEKLLGEVSWASDQPVPPRYAFNKAFFESLFKVDIGDSSTPIQFTFAGGPTKPVGFRAQRGDGGIEGVLMPVRIAT